MVPHNSPTQHLLRVVTVIAQKLVPPHKVEDFCTSVAQMFQSACRKGETTLTVAQLESLVVKVKEMRSEFKCTFTAADAVEIHRALDADGDNTISQHEWTAWLLRGAALSYQERSKFSAKSDLHDRMTNFLEAVCISCGGADLLHGMTLGAKAHSAAQLSIEDLTKGLQTLFYQFDTDKSGFIDESELKAMMIDLPMRFYVSPEDIPVEGDVSVVMEALDADGNGEVDFEEWKQWIVANRAMDDETRVKFAAQSDVHRRLDKFVSTLVEITEEMVAPLGDAASLRPGLVQIFREAANGQGSVGAEEVLKMVNTLSAKHPEVTWFTCSEDMAKTITEALDADGNGSVEMEEWVEWMVRGAARPALDRAKFAAHSKTFALLTQFLEAVSTVAKKLTLLDKAATT